MIEGDIDDSITVFGLVRSSSKNGLARRCVELAGTDGSFSRGRLWTTVEYGQSWCVDMKTSKYRFSFLFERYPRIGKATYPPPAQIVLAGKASG